MSFAPIPSPAPDQIPGENHNMPLITNPNYSMDAPTLRTQASEVADSEFPTTQEKEPSPPPTTVIHPSPGPYSTPQDDLMEYNAFHLPESFEYRVLGISSEHLRHNVLERAKQEWQRARNFSVIIVPFYMSFSLTQIQKAKTNTTIFLKRAFPGSQGTLTVIPAAKAMDQQGEEPLPWGIMIAGLMYCDAATLLHHQFWLSKAFCFVAYPTTPFISTWIGNWAFAMNENDKPTVIECLKSNLANAHTKIGKYLHTKIPDAAEHLFVIESAKVQPINVIKQNSEATHWAFTVDSPHPTDANQHKQWITAAEATVWYHAEIATGELCNPRNTCKCCKGKDHVSARTVIWPARTPIQIG
ncbi:uncharacterized protein EI90DRAFT_3122692 [Cantharellus anzutake]|uniref:uncharacterized protein n=1 Tax=Cantharellus anzutake TaxID=1750568 RepID=UPI001908F535|nr:uncharacterized protein EI90DRAFT_3122692 [Cantharellus anzutake]KAF8332249.1 hypothetical protein EI90DRAFT_3122692 [Cantharellus anzutake]